MDDDQAVPRQRLSALRATAHPVRLQMLSLLTGTAMSAAEVARELGLTHANASYHLRTLLDVGELVVDGEEKIRGGVAKRYRYPHETGGRASTGHRPEIPVEDQLRYVRAVGSEVERRLLAGASPHGHTAFDLEGWVDVETWEKARDLVRQASVLLHDANRPPRTSGTVPVSASSWLFRLEHDGETAGGA